MSRTGQVGVPPKQKHCPHYSNAQQSDRGPSRSANILSAAGVARRSGPRGLVAGPIGVFTAGDGADSGGVTPGACLSIKSCEFLGVHG